MPVFTTLVDLLVYFSLDELSEQRSNGLTN